MGSLLLFIDLINELFNEVLKTSSSFIYTDSLISESNESGGKVPHAAGHF